MHVLIPVGPELEVLRPPPPPPESVLSENLRCPMAPPVTRRKLLSGEESPEEAMLLAALKNVREILKIFAYTEAKCDCFCKRLHINLLKDVHTYFTRSMVYKGHLYRYIVNLPTDLFLRMPLSAASPMTFPVVWTTEGRRMTRLGTAGMASAVPMEATLCWCRSRCHSAGFGTSSSFSLFLWCLD